MRGRWIIGALTALSLAQLALAETFEDLTFLALNKDPRISAATAAAQAEEARLQQIITTGRPQINSSIYSEGLESEERTYIARIELSQELYSFGRIASSIEAARERVELGWIEVARTNQDVFADVSIAYANVLEADEIAALRQAFLGELQGRGSQVLERIDAGLASIIEYQALARRLAEAEVSVLLAEQEATKARLEMERLTGTFISQTSGNGLSIYLRLMPTNLADVRFLADANSPEAHVSEARFKIVEADVKASNRANLPSLETYGSIDYGERAGVEVNDQQLGIRLSVPLYQGGLRGAVREEGELSVQEALRLRQQDQLQIALAASNAWVDVDIAERSTEVWRRTLRIQRDQESAVQNEVDADLSTLDALLDVQAAIVDTQAELIRSRFNIIRAQLVLLRTIGYASPIAR